LPQLIEEKSPSLPSSEKRRWAEARLDDLEAARLEALQAALDRGGRWDVAFEDGELRLYNAGAPVLAKIYLDETPGRLAEAYWRFLILGGLPHDAKRLATDLRQPPAASEAPAARQFVERVAALAAEIAAIDSDERALNGQLYDLYNLSPAERNLVENQRQRRKDRAAAG
jgi:hypothetical protein